MRALAGSAGAYPANGFKARRRSGGLPECASPLRATSSAPCGGRDGCRLAPRSDLFAQAGAQPRNGLAVQLADARFGNTENVADLAQVELFLIVQRHHLLLALGQVL